MKIHPLVLVGLLACVVMVCISCYMLGAMQGDERNAVLERQYDSAMDLFHKMEATNSKNEANLVRCLGLIR